MLEDAGDDSSILARADNGRETRLPAGSRANVVAIDDLRHRQPVVPNAKDRLVPGRDAVNGGICIPAEPQRSGDHLDQNVRKRSSEPIVPFERAWNDYSR